MVCRAVTCTATDPPSLLHPKAGCRPNTGLKCHLYMEIKSTCSGLLFQEEQASSTNQQGPSCHTSLPQPTNRKSASFFGSFPGLLASRLKLLSTSSLTVSGRVTSHRADLGGWAMCWVHACTAKLVFSDTVSCCPTERLPDFNKQADMPWGGCAHAMHQRLVTKNTIAQDA